MKSHTCDSTVTTNHNGNNSAVLVTNSNNISLEDTIKEHSPNNLKGKTICKITIKETKKEFDAVHCTKHIDTLSFKFESGRHAIIKTILISRLHDDTLTPPPLG